MLEHPDVVTQFRDLFSVSLQKRTDACGCRFRSKYTMRWLMAYTLVATWRDSRRRWLIRKHLLRAEAHFLIWGLNHQFARSSSEKKPRGSICFSVPGNK